MDLRFTSEEIAFRDEVRTFCRTEIPAEIRREGLGGAQPHQGRLRHEPADPQRQGLGGAALAAGMGRPGLDPDPALHLHRGAVPGGRAAAAAVQLLHVRPGAGDLRPAGSEGTLPPARGQSGRLVVPGLLRTRRRLRPRLAEDQGGARRRPLRRGRPEDLDDARPARRLDLLPGAHRFRGQEAARHLLPPHRHEDARDHRAADPDVGGPARGQRGFLRRRARARREPRGRGEQGLGLREIPARQRAHRHRPDRAHQGADRPDQAAGPRDAGRVRDDVGRSRLPRSRRGGRGRAEGPGDHPDAGGGQAGPGGFGGAGPRLVAPQDPRLAAPAGGDRAAASSSPGPSPSRRPRAGQGPTTCPAASTGSTPPRRATSTTARSRSTAARTRSSTTSSPRAFWVCEPSPRSNLSLVLRGCAAGLAGGLQGSRRLPEASFGGLRCAPAPQDEGIWWDGPVPGAPTISAREHHGFRPERGPVAPARQRRAARRRPLPLAGEPAGAAQGAPRLPRGGLDGLRRSSASPACPSPRRRAASAAARSRPCWSWRRSAATSWSNPCSRASCWARRPSGSAAAPRRRRASSQASSPATCA